jgi:hypothetical protein
MAFPILAVLSHVEERNFAIIRQPRLQRGSVNDTYHPYPRGNDLLATPEPSSARVVTMPTTAGAGAASMTK